MFNAYTFRMPAGIPGTISRNASQATVEPQVFQSSTPFSAFGLPGAIDATSGQFRPITTGDAASAVYGFLVRPFPATNGASGDGLGSATPPSSGVCDVLKRGYISAHLGGSTAAAKNGTVYVRVANASTGKVIGDVEAASDSTNTVTLTNAYFTGPADSNGNVEIAYNI